MKRLRRRLYEIVESHDVEDRASWWFKVSIMALISVSAVSVVLETVPWLHDRWGHAFWLFEALTVLLFSGEYLARLWVCVEDRKYARPIRGRLRWMFTPMALLDLAAVLPFYLPLVAPVDLRMLRALRLVRLARVFELGGYGDTLETVSAVVHDKKEELLVTTCVAVVALVVFSSLVYFIEHPGQPEKFSSIPATFWWGVTTMTTTNCDIMPMTSLGRVVAGCAAVTGVGLFALPAGIIGSGFVEEMHRRHASAARRPCPHCGKAL